MKKNGTKNKQRRLWAPRQFFFPFFKFNDCSCGVSSFSFFIEIGILKMFRALMFKMATPTIEDCCKVLCYLTGTLLKKDTIVKIQYNDRSRFYFVRIYFNYIYLCIARCSVLWYRSNCKIIIVKIWKFCRVIIFKNEVNFCTGI